MGLSLRRNKRPVSQTGIGHTSTGTFQAAHTLIATLRSERRQRRRRKRKSGGAFHLTPPLLTDYRDLVPYAQRVVRVMGAAALRPIHGQGSVSAMCRCQR
ncbi:hypothetical protein EYF80_009195 [Liparis tanakae]|uniref:Uncharacterized protein n=1 Tax=Liparis tanakae TaxID=230148 RepID=A0A4Z2IRH2_9TELE|nr:hypothetical protein EYF80_009195 [Liparis tanakae]